MYLRLLSFLACIIPLPLLAAEAKFATPPKVDRESSETVITFAVAESTDVEVAVLDSNGRIVSHLAAGVLGGKIPPPAPLKSGLTHRLVLKQ